MKHVVEKPRSGGPKRAITLAGGGPAAGLHIGALERLEELGITFDVWALSCIGAWVGLVYNQFDPPDRGRKTYDFFKDGVFRDDESYRHFPINRVFGPDWLNNAKALIRFGSDPNTYEKLLLPNKILEAYQETFRFMADPSRWNEGDLYQLWLNHGLAVNPLARFMTSMMFLSEISGLARIHFPESTFLKAIDFAKINRAEPFIYHNAYNLTRDQLDLFCNKDTESWRNKGYLPLNASSLCACSALPYIEGTVKIGSDTYCEGALVDTVNFKSLIEDHPDLDEIWINRIVDQKQIREPKTLTDALANLCQLFAATVGEDDIELFKYHVRYKEDGKRWYGTIVEIQVARGINFEWNHSNLDMGVRLGRDAAGAAFERYMAETGGQRNTAKEVRIIGEKKPPQHPSRGRKLASAAE